MTRTSLARRLLPAVIVGAAAFFFTGCPSNPTDSSSDVPSPVSVGRSGAWVGTADGSDTFVAVVADGTQVLAYVCESGKTGAWFTGAQVGNELGLANAAGASLTVSLGDTAQGVVTLKDGAELTFTAAPTTEEILYRAEMLAEEGDAGVVAGWIKLGDRVQGSLAFSSLATSTLSPAPDLQVNNPAITGLFPTPMTPTSLGSSVANNVTFLWAALGDSYAAGEGNPESPIANPAERNNFSGLRWGDDSSHYVPVSGVTQTADTFTCHRSDKAPAVKTQARLRETFPSIGFKLGFVACSGATTTDLVDAGYTGPGTRDEAMRGHTRVPQPAQLDRVKTFVNNNGGKLDLLYMSIGGNDFGFAKIVEDCYHPVDGRETGCVNDQAAALPGTLTRMRQGLARVDQVIEQRFGVALPVFHSRYPHPLDNGGNRNPPVCRAADYELRGETEAGEPDDFIQDNVTEQEADFLYGLLDDLNGVVEEGPTSRGWRLVDEPPFRGHGICTADNFINLNSDGMKTQGIDLDSPLPLSAGLFHPNDKGYEKYADVMVKAFAPVVRSRLLAGLPSVTNLRVAATGSGEISIAWNDRANTENLYEVRVTGMDAESISLLRPPPTVHETTTFGYVDRLVGKDLNAYPHLFRPGRGHYRYSVRPCATNDTGVPTCGPWVEVEGTNAIPPTPTGLTLTAVDSSKTRYAWGPSRGALEYVLRVPAEGGSEVRTTQLSLTLFRSRTPARVAACNRAGCSAFSPVAQ
jgi:lysophospholipase L1-like esterase